MKNYLCEKCKVAIQKDGIPGQTGCTGGGNTNHQWVDLGEAGNDNYQCKKCAVLIKSKGTPRQLWCPSGGNHQWSKLSIMFEPWIGKEYDSQSDFPKTLILGESHYGNQHEGRYDLSKKTILCIEDQIKWNNTYPFYTRLVSSLTGKKPSFENKGYFWHKVAYHNLITEPLKSKRCCPTVEQWETSIETLTRVIEGLKPEYCIVLGYRMWRKLHNRFDFEPCTCQYDAGPCGVVYSPSMNCYFHGTKHPSGRGFVNAEWCSWIDNFIKEKWPNKSFQRTNHRHRIQT